MTMYPAPLRETADALRTGRIDLLETIKAACDRLEQDDTRIQAFLPEPGRRERLRRQAADLQARFPDANTRPPLYGVLIGVKDIFHVDGFATRAGSQFPDGILTGSEAESVRLLRAAGALVLGKTVTAEFAYSEPGPTRNPRNLAHTPGGSSSGSAAAVASGFCPLALGTQTIGSVIRPAAYCGIIGFKPGYGRISTSGVLPVSRSLDHVGIFTQDIAGVALAASILCQTWDASPTVSAKTLPTLGVPTGAYLEQATMKARIAFETHVAMLEAAGYTVRRIPAFHNIAAINQQTYRLMAAEAADAHANLFAQFELLYRPRTSQLIRDGMALKLQERRDAAVCQQQTYDDVLALMSVHEIDVWIAPAATSAAPEGLASTGDSVINLPWTLTGLPTIALPTNTTTETGLPYAVQCAATPGQDERLIQWAARLAGTLAGTASVA